MTSPSRRPPPPTSPSESVTHILFIDDERHVQRAFADAAESLGFRVDLASTATQALRAVEAKDYAVLAVDLSLPGLDGIGLVERLREVSPKSAFLLLTGAPKLELPERPDLELDAAVLLKPWLPDQLSAALLASVERAKQLKERPSSAPVASVTAGVLIIDADADRAAVSLDTLHAAGLCTGGCRVVDALESAAEALSDGHFDLVLLHEETYVAAGPGAFVRLRLTAPETALIVMSPTANESAAVRVAQLGAQDLFSSPLSETRDLRTRLLVAHERKRYARRVAYLARYDHLTGLPNRAAFHDRLAHALARFRREDESFGVMFVDLDRFAHINDTYGLHAGDHFLREIAHRLQTCLREGDTLARLGGDEFAMIIEGPISREGVSDVARRVREAMSEPIPVQGQPVVPQASIGGAICPDAGDTLEALLTAADSAMYGGKRGGGNRFSMAGQVNSTAALSRLRQEGQLRYALERQQFQLVYQPKVSLGSQKVVGFEALIRWQNAMGQDVSPAEFVPILESLGMIVDVGAWVVDAACAQLAVWRTQGHADVRMAVNLSPIQLEDEGVLTTITRCLERHDIPAAALDVEITETTLLRSTARSQRVLAALRELGVRVALDDFGTGHSSLAHLATFDVDALKIDRSFVIAEDTRSRAIVASIVELAHRLQIEVVAEGVETEAQRVALEAAGCDVVQGFLLGRPVPPEEITF